MLSYSPNGGTSWNPAATVGLPDGAADTIVAGVGAGNAELAYTHDNDEYLVPVSYAQSRAVAAADRRHPSRSTTEGHARRGNDQRRSRTPVSE